MLRETELQIPRKFVSCFFWVPVPDKVVKTSVV